MHGVYIFFKEKDMHEATLCSLGLSANQPAVLFSHTKLVPAISYQPVSSTVLS
jgi:hypothetical protein